MIRARLNSITRLARAGALEQAWTQFHAAGLDPDANDPDTLTVYGRLLKDRAAQEKGRAREDLLNRAIIAYERASTLSGATYPLINAATLAHLVGQASRARALARAVIALLDSPSRASDTPYWLDATRAEALLLLGQAEDAERILGQAIAHQPEAYEDHASTLRQFAMILAKQGRSADWLDHYRPAAPLYFEGILGLSADDIQAAEAIAQAVDALAPSMVIGALAAGADILVAEAAVRRNCQLHVVLPCPAELFRSASVDPFGREWAGRFDGLMAQAVSVREMDDWHPLSNESVKLARQAAMGLALCEAKRLQSSPRALQIAGQGEAPQADMTQWSALGLHLDRLEVERSNGSQIALPTAGDAEAILALPEHVTPAPAASAVELDVQEGQHAYSLSSLPQAARLMAELQQQHPAARLGLDYRVMTEDKGRWCARALMIGGADLDGAVALSEPAALALNLYAPDANIQPMGDIRTPVGDLPLYGLFPDPADGAFSEA